MQLSEYFVWSLLFSLYEEGIIVFTIPGSAVGLDSTYVAWGTGFTSVMYGWPEGLPCQFVATSPHNTEKQIEIRE